jgi:spore germination cell wall hydrolase CwlJ-like protein
MILTAAAATCLALNVYFEARNQDTDGQILVAEVTMNRVADDRFPDEICAVVWQNKAFSWTHDGKPDVPKNIEAWLKAQIVSYEVLLNGCVLYRRSTRITA